MWSALTKTSDFRDETPLRLEKCLSEKPRRSCPFFARVCALPLLQKVPFPLFSTAMSFPRSPKTGNHEKWCQVKTSDCRKGGKGAAASRWSPFAGVFPAPRGWKVDLVRDEKRRESFHLVTCHAPLQRRRWSYLSTPTQSLDAFGIGLFLKHTFPG